MTIDLQPWKDRLAHEIAKARHGPGIKMDNSHTPRPTEIQAASRFVDDLAQAVEIDVLLENEIIG